MEQPNATGDGYVPLTVRFWIALAAIALMQLLGPVTGRIVPLLAAG